MLACKSLSKITLPVNRLLVKILERFDFTGEVFYVGSAEALPPPLSGEEEAALLKRLIDGDHEVRAELIERNLRLVVYIARKFENTGINIED